MSSSVFGDLRDVCRCGHVRSSHLDRSGPCRPRSKAGCPCKAWSPGVPVWDAGPPEGVVIVRPRVRRHPATVACHHPAEARVARVGYPGELCSICKATAFDRPVKLLAFVDVPSTLF